MERIYSPPWHIWITDWHFDPYSVLGLVGMLALYFGGVYALRERTSEEVRLKRYQLLCFGGGIFLTAFAILSPLDELGEHFSFAVHMVQHLLMIIPIPILLLLGTPDWLVRPILRIRVVEYALRIMTHPLLITIVFNLVFLGWHIPSLYERALVDPQIHILEHVTFIGAALLSWWPIMGPSHQLSTSFLKIGYIFIQKLPSTVLGAVLVFAESPLYAGYQQQSVRLWGWSPLLDQQIGGVIMWVPAGLVYLLVLSVVFFRWMSDAEAVSEQQGSFA